MKSPKYSRTSITRWLSFLAKNMEETGQTIFLIEELQVNWLPRNQERILHWLTTVLLMGFISGMVWSIVFGPVFGLLLGLAFSVLFSMDKKSWHIEPQEYLSWTWHALYRNITNRKINDAPKGVVFGLIFGLFLGWIDNQQNIWVTSIILAISGGLIGSINAGWERELTHSTTTPNERIRKTIPTSLKGIVFGGFMGFLLEVSLFFFFQIEAEILFGFTGILTGGIIGALWFGGMAIVRHYTLRMILFIRGYGPWDYAGFLDYLVDELQFMQRVGGGYIFIHRMLLEHFAGIPNNEDSQD